MLEWKKVNWIGSACFALDAIGAWGIIEIGEDTYSWETFADGSMKFQKD